MMNDGLVAAYIKKGLLHRKGTCIALHRIAPSEDGVCVASAASTHIAELWKYNVALARIYTSMVLRAGLHV